MKARKDTDALASEALICSFRCFLPGGRCFLEMIKPFNFA